jgi:hypothetical protein
MGVGGKGVLGRSGPTGKRRGWSREAGKKMKEAGWARVLKSHDSWLEGCRPI